MVFNSPNCDPFQLNTIIFTLELNLFFFFIYTHQSYINQHVRLKPFRLTDHLVTTVTSVACVLGALGRHVMIFFDWKENFDLSPVLIAQMVESGLHCCAK